MPGLMIMIKKYWIIFGLLFCLCAAVPCFSEESNRESPFPGRLKEYAQTMVHFPLYPFTRNPQKWRMLPEPSFYEFMEFARGATESDLAACASWLSEATAKERCLIFVVLFCSLDTKYLPVIAKYRNDAEPAFSCLGDPAFNHEFAAQLRLRRENHEPISRCEYHHFFPRPIRNTHVRELREHFPFEVGDFARAILGCWDCFPAKLPVSARDAYDTSTINDPWPEFTSEDWARFEAEDHRLRYYLNLYATRVLCILPERIDTETVVFLKTIEKLPLPLRVEILLQTSLYVAENPNFMKLKLIFYTSQNYPFPCDAYEETVPNLREKLGTQTNLWRYPCFYALWKSENPHFYDRQWHDFLNDASLEELRQAAEIPASEEEWKAVVEQIQKHIRHREYMHRYLLYGTILTAILAASLFVFLTSCRLTNPCGEVKRSDILHPIKNLL